MSSRKDRRRRRRSTSIYNDDAYYQNVHSSSRRHKKEHRSRSEIRRNDEINHILDEIKNLEQKIERLEMSRSPNRSRRSQYSRRERSVQSCERRRRSPKYSSSRESSQSQNRELFKASKSSNRSCGSLYSRKETSASKRTSTDRACDRRRRSPSHPSSRRSSQSQDSSYSRGRGEQFKTSKSSNRSCGSLYSRKETSVSKRTSTDRAYERRTRSQSRSSSQESNQRQNRSHSRERKRSRSGSHSRKRDLGYQHQPTRNSRRSRTPDRQHPSLPAHWNRPRIQSDKAGTNISSRYLELPGIVDKKQNCYESKARLDPGELTADPDNKSYTSRKATPSKKPNQNEPLECVNLQKFPFDEFELIGDSLSHYLARAVWKKTANVRKPYLQEQITLTALYNSIKPVTFTKTKAIVSMAQFELNFTNTYYKIVQRRIMKVIKLLIEKGFEKIIILFPVIKPVAGNKKPVSVSSYLMYIRAFEEVCDYRRVTLWWKPAAVFLQMKKDERCPGKMTFDKDEDGNMIPTKWKFYRHMIGGIFRPDRDRKHEVLVEIDKLYLSAYFSGKRPEMDFEEE